jgi:hypothetical protein
VIAVTLDAPRDDVPYLPALTAPRGGYRAGVGRRDAGALRQNGGRVEEQVPCGNDK